MYNVLRSNLLRASSLTLLLASFSLSACGGGNSAAGPAPNTGNIPNLATRPSTQASQLKKVRLTGSVFNSQTGTPIEKAEIQLQLIDTAAASQPGSAPIPTAPPSGPAQIPTPPPGSGPVVPGAATPMPNPTPSATSPVGATPIPAPSILPPGQSEPTQPPPGMTPPPPPDLPPNDGMRVPDAQLPLPARDARTLSFSAQGAAAQTASYQVTQATPYQVAQATPVPSDKEAPNLFRTDSNNKGKFFLNDIPDGRFLLTITAPGYRSLTLTEPNPTGLEIPLTPLESTRVIDVVGMVLSPTETPVGDAIVSPSFPLGEALGVPSTTNDVGEFVLLDVPFGRHTLVAFTLDENQQIRQMGYLKDVPISDKTLKVKNPAMAPGGGPAPTPKPDPSAREKLLDNVEKMLIEPDPEAAPSQDPEIWPPASESTEPESTQASPAPDTSLEPTPAPDSEPEVLPSASPALDPLMDRFEENEEKQAPKGFNLLEAVTELVTGEKPKDGESDEEIYPVIPLRSVLNELELAGTIEVPEDFVVKSVDVYLSLPTAKDEPPQEVYLLTQPIRAVAVAESPKPGASPAPDSAAKKPTQRFRLSLPNLEKDHSYHLQLTASKEGELSYHHLYNLSKSNEELAVSFMGAPSEIQITGEDTNAVPPVPSFSWQAAPGAELYHLTLEAGNGAKRRIVWEAWTKNTEVKYPLSTRTQRLREQESYTVSVAALKGLRPATNDQKTQYALPSYRAIWTDLSRVTHAPFEVVE